jgi:NhaA family Na+:H+ antiporter
MTISAIREFLRHESAGGIVLLGAAALALILTNSPLSAQYLGFFDLHLTVTLNGIGLDKPLGLWINDGLMAVFFFLVGLEIKRELIEGELSTLRQAMLPVLAAIGGMAAPAFVYALVNAETPQNLAGWAIPTATDIAFALAIMDDLGAIIVIAIFYTADLSPMALSLSLIGIAALFIMNKLGVRRLAAYILVGIYVWACVLESGVHATLAGTIVGLCVPLRGRDRQRLDDHQSLAKRCIHTLHPWVAFAIMPAFALANAGVSLAGLTSESLLSPVSLGIILGLFVGKQIGVVAALLLARATGLAQLPSGATWAEAYGVAVITGIGFTMSLFIGSLAFADPATIVQMRLGVIAGSVLSACWGLAVLWLATRHREAAESGRAAAAS